MNRIGILGGSGFYEMKGLRHKSLRRVSTPFGNPSGEFRISEVSGSEVVFLPRHGIPHRIPPHRINYRANIWGFREMGIERIFSINAVGGITAGLTPGDIVIPDQIIDLTQGRASTFYEENDVVHIDFTDPYCTILRTIICAAAQRKGLTVKESGTYLCVNGPRLETRAEISFFAKSGADVVGMTGMPEACLARELEMCFASVLIVTNYAAGISDKKLTTTEVMENMKISTERIGSLLIESLALLPEERICACRYALSGAKM
ncbi:MAG TPA: 5'-methylthioadenosine phosphorylase [Nitrospiraceae bacterium]|jgi:5'-methylthioadenosine phosphorylase|nr:5'-methylthioadenosine phosphorylase [Nitrospiraceae bacterium]